MFAMYARSMNFLNFHEFHEFQACLWIPCTLIVVPWVSLVVAWIQCSMKFGGFLTNLREHAKSVKTEKNKLFAWFTTIHTLGENVHCFLMVFTMFHSFSILPWWFCLVFLWCLHVFPMVFGWSTLLIDGITGISCKLSGKREKNVHLLNVPGN